MADASGKNNCHLLLNINYTAGILIVDLWIMETSDYQVFKAPYPDPVLEYGSKDQNIGQ